MKEQATLSSAVNYLAENGITKSEVAEALGYFSCTSLSKACRRGSKNFHGVRRAKVTSLLNLIDLGVPVRTIKSVLKEWKAQPKVRRSPRKRVERAVPLQKDNTPPSPSPSPSPSVANPSVFTHHVEQGTLHVAVASAFVPK